MTLYDELYFEITATGAKSEIKRFINYLKSGELDDFFEFDTEYINYDDDYADAGNDQEVSVVISNDDFGIEIDEFCPEDFLDEFCKAARALDVQGHMYDIDDEEFYFVSEAGDSYFVKGRGARTFNDELDAAANAEEQDDEEE